MNSLIPISVAARRALVAAIGQDAVQAIMAAPFSVVSDDLPRADNMVPELIADDGDNVIIKSDDDGWAASGWREAALEYHKARDGRVSITSYAPEHLARLRRLLDDDVSLGRAWPELSRPSGAATSTAEALAFSLRSRGVQALGEPDVLRRLAQLDNTQLREVAIRLQKLEQHIAPAWTLDNVAILFAVRSKIDGQDN